MISEALKYAAVMLGIVGVCSNCLAEQRRAPSPFQLRIRGGDDFVWLVNLNEAGYEAEKVKHNEGKRANTLFVRRGHFFAEVGGTTLAYDVSGKTLDVLQRTRREDGTDWKIHGNRLSTRLQARQGPLKGWWVGLAPKEDSVDEEEVRIKKLVLVEKEKDAAYFSYPDSSDEGR